MPRNCHDVNRTFHPIGQGAFYSEKHQVSYPNTDYTTTYNIVYDCGTKSSKSLKSRGRYPVNLNCLFNKAFRKGEKIDILFISHFDNDHVNCISALQKYVGNIDYVMMPLLNAEQKTLLVNINTSLNSPVARLLNNPAEFFGKGTKLIYVEATEPDDDYRQAHPRNEDRPPDNRDEPLNIDKESPRRKQLEIDGVAHDGEETKTIASGAKVSFAADPTWTFQPYNFKDVARTQMLYQKLRKKKICPEKLSDKSSNGYILKRLKSNGFAKKLRDIYESIDGTANENSLLLYSGPVDHLFYRHHYHYYYYDCSYHHCYYRRVKLPPGCIYTGDTDLNKISLLAPYTSYQRHVGTIQIPHHGAASSFCENNIRQFINSPNYSTYCIFPMSFGIPSAHKHPSSNVVNKVRSLGENIGVSNNPNSRYVQWFRVYFR